MKAAQTRVALLIFVLPLLLFQCQSTQHEEGWCDKLPRSQYDSLKRMPSADDWFQVYEVEDSVYAIYEPYQWQEVISYLIIGRHEALLFDTGNGIGNIRKVVDGLTSLPVFVLNSHTHFDHVGGNADYDSILGMDTEYTRLRAKGRAHRDIASEVSPAALCRALPAGMDSAQFISRPFRVTQFIHEGHEIDLGNRKLQVIAVPGHTPDAIALWDKDNGLLWTGDTYYDGPIWLFDPITNMDDYEKSVDRLAGLVPSLRFLLPAHNTPLAQPARLTELKSAFQKVRDHQVKGHLKDGGQVEFMFDHFSILTREDLVNRD